MLIIKKNKNRFIGVYKATTFRYLHKNGKQSEIFMGW